jgi:hypothetical protein
MEIGIPKLIIKTMIEQEGNFDLTSRMFVGKLYPSLAQIQATIQ